MMKKLLIILFFSLISVGIFAQDVMMQGWYWDFFKQNNNGLRWAKHLEQKAVDLKKAGFTYVWLPPANRTSTPNDTSNGYNPRDLFDYGSPINGLPRPTMLGSRSELDDLISTFSANNIKAVADLVYNHRDGGKLEKNTAVKYYVDNFTSNKSPFPCDRMVIALPLGAQNPGANGAGDYYIKFSSKTGSYGSNFRYNLYMKTSQTTTFLGTVDETEPNGGGDCGQAFNTIQLGQDIRAYLGNNNNCGTDEFKLTLTAANLRDNGTTKDTLWIYMRPLEGGYADQRPYGIWSTQRNANIVNELMYMTYTDFSGLPSGLGSMNFESFRPNTASQATETLQGDQNSMLFFYDYDQNNATTKTVLNDWTKWNWNNVGIRGFRLDAVKHFPASHLSQLLNDLNANNINPGLVVGESYDGNPGVLKGWVDAVKSGMNANALAAIQPRVFDFALRGALRDASDTPGYDVRNVFSSGVVDGAGGSGINTVTFLNNHDFRNTSGWDAPVQNNPMLGYAYLLTNNKVGLPCVFYPDYYGISYPFAPTVNLKSQIDTLISLHKQHIFGATQVEYLNKEGVFYQTATGAYISGSKTSSLIYQIKGGASGRDVIVAINYGSTRLQVDHVINSSGNPTGTRFYDMLNNSAFPYAEVNSSGKIYIDLPPKSYSVWVRNVPPQLMAKAFLNSVDTATLLMDDFLKTDPSFPSSDPYAAAPFNTSFTHVNSGVTATIPSTVLSITGNNAIVDWMFLELRKGPSGATSVVATKAALIQKDGDIVAMDGVSPVTFEAAAGSYYVAVRHRNNLGFRTANPIVFGGTPVTLNFTNNSVALQNSSLTLLKPNLYAMSAGDANADGSVDSFDSIDWEFQNGLFNNPYTLNADYNLDGSVDAFDSILWEFSNGKFQELD
jgi:alpha-amylase